jgi:dienelactone hydrolase
MDANSSSGCRVSAAPKKASKRNCATLAAAGFVALAFDPYQHGERSVDSHGALGTRVVGNIRRHFWPILAHTAEETTRVIDWAISELGVAQQVGMGGISMGGDISVAAAGADKAHHGCGRLYRHARLVASRLVRAAGPARFLRATLV